MSLSIWSFQGTLWIQRILQRFEYKADLEFNKGKINFNIYVEAVVESWMMHYSAGNDELGWIAFNTREIMELHKTFRISPFKPFTLIDNTQNSTKDQRRWRLHNLKSSQYLINFSTTWKITCIWLDSNVAWSWPKWLNKMILHWYALQWLKISEYFKKIAYFPHNFCWSEPEKAKKKETDCFRDDRHPSLSTQRLEDNSFAAEVIIAGFKQCHIFLFFFAYNFFVCSQVIFQSSSKLSTSSSKSFC